LGPRLPSELDIINIVVMLDGWSADERKDAMERYPKIYKLPVKQVTLISFYVVC
jgi:hypothetical protein